MLDIHRLLIVFCLVLCGMSTFPALAEDSIYEVKEVSVDVSAENAVAAREKAFNEAQVNAYKILMERLLTPDDLASHAIPDISVISNMVQDFEVTNEQLSAVRYKGTYTIRFRPAAVQKTIGTSSSASSQGTAGGGTQVKAKPMLILPFYQTAGKTKIWDDANPFMAAWARSGREGEVLVNTVLPLGDLLDVAQLQDDQALNYDLGLVNKMLARYRAGQAIILIAEETPGVGISVAIYKADAVMPTFMRSIAVDAKPGVPKDMLYDIAVRDVMMALKQEKSSNAQATAKAPQTETYSGPTQTLNARAKFNNVQEWVRLKKTLETVQGVRTVKVYGLKSKEAVMHIDYTGTLDSLNTGMIGAGVVLQSTAGQGAPYNAQIPGSILYDVSLRTRGY